MFSACLARLITTFSGLKLQAIINAQIDEKNCLEWGNKISSANYFSEIASVHPIHNRLVNEPKFMVSELYYNSIRSLIISFSSTLEFFLKDNTRLNMMRNYSLLKKGLMETKQVIDPKDIVEINDIELVRLKYINTISSVVCSGELWSNKLKKYIKFLNLPNDLCSQGIHKKIDSIWKVRNDIAHGNTQILSLSYDEITYKYGTDVNEAEYTQFALLFIKLVDETIEFLSEVDKMSLEKWKTTDGTLLYRKRNTTTNQS